MRDIIQRHNRLNGILFSVIEFGFIGLFIGVFAIYYLLHHQVVRAFVSSGITVNCIPVVVYGIRQIADDRSSGTHSGSYWNKPDREQHRRENPHMLRDALLLCLGTLLPFVSLAAVLFDVFKRPRQ